MTFLRENLPDPVGYFESCGLQFRERKGTWRTTRCAFHEGSDSMRVNTRSGAWVCMSCAARGGDVLSYHRAATGLDFVSACKELGAWVDDGSPAPAHQRPAPFPARQALELLAAESNLVATAAANIAHGVTLSQIDLQRLLQAAGNIGQIARAAL